MIGWKFNKPNREFDDFMLWLRQRAQKMKFFDATLVNHRKVSKYIFEAKEVWEKYKADEAKRLTGQGRVTEKKKEVESGTNLNNSSKASVRKLQEGDSGNPEVPSGK